MRESERKGGREGGRERGRERGREGGRVRAVLVPMHAILKNDNGNLKDISYTIGYFLFLSICSKKCY